MISTYYNTSAAYEAPLVIKLLIFTGVFKPTVFAAFFVPFLNYYFF